MNRDWPDIAGRFADGRHLLPIRVYYEDTDFSGAVYHANYLKFCERARSDCLRLAGIYHSALHWHQTQGRLGFVVRHMTCDFLRPARIDDLLEVETRLLAVAGARIDLKQNVKRGSDILFGAEVRVALVDGGGRPRRLPAEMMAQLRAHLRPVSHPDSG